MMLALPFLSVLACNRTTQSRRLQLQTADDALFCPPPLFPQSPEPTVAGNLYLTAINAAKFLFRQTLMKSLTTRSSAFAAFSSAACCSALSCSNTPLVPGVGRDLRSSSGFVTGGSG